MLVLKITGNLTEADILGVPGIAFLKKTKSIQTSFNIKGIRRKFDLDLNKLKEKQRLELVSLEARYINRIKAVEQQRESELRSLEERQMREMFAFEALGKRENKK